MTGIDPLPYLRALADGLGKCGVPVQIRQGEQRAPYVRASHPRPAGYRRALRTAGGRCLPLHFGVGHRHRAR
jgi:hypothetical protein